MVETNTKKVSALLLVDLLSDFTFPGGGKLARQLLKRAGAISKLASRFRRARMPVIYVNDNFGRWDEDLARLAVQAQASRLGKKVLAFIAPQPGDLFVLKPHLSAFYQTPLEHLLASRRIRDIVIAGVATDKCVLATALDAHMRKMRIAVPVDCSAAVSPGDHASAIEIIRRGAEARIGRSANLRL